MFAILVHSSVLRPVDLNWSVRVVQCGSNDFLISQVDSCFGCETAEDVTLFLDVAVEFFRHYRRVNVALVLYTHLELKRETDHHRNGGGHYVCNSWYAVDATHCDRATVLESKPPNANRSTQ